MEILTVEFEAFKSYLENAFYVCPHCGNKNGLPVDGILNTVNHRHSANTSLFPVCIWCAAYWPTSTDELIKQYRISTNL